MRKVLIVHPWTGTVLDTQDGVLRVEVDSEDPNYMDDHWVVEQAKQRGVEVV